MCVSYELNSQCISYVIFYIFIFLFISQPTEWIIMKNVITNYNDELITDL